MNIYRNVCVLSLATLISMQFGCDSDNGDTVAVTDAEPCFATHLFTGIGVQVAEVTGNTGRFIATATYSPDGYPLITYGPRYFQLSRLEQKMIERHECAHLSAPTTDEIYANCLALLDMRAKGLTTEQENQLRNWTSSYDAVDAQYGSTGESFWNLTVQCAGPRT